MEDGGNETPHQNKPRHAGFVGGFCRTEAKLALIWTMEACGVCNGWLWMHRVPVVDIESWPQ